MEQTISVEFLRVSLQLGKCPFGWAVQISGKAYTYYINRKQFLKFLDEKEKDNAKEF